MMDAILNTMKAQAQLERSGSATVKIGIVSSYDSVNYCAKVRLQPDNTETGWLPVTSPWIGNGWGMFCPVSIGDTVEIQFQEGSLESGFICGRLYNDGIRPLNAPCGELWLVHKSGQFIKLLNDGSIASSGTWNHAGNINVTGTLTATVDVVGGGKSLKTHVHSGVQSGGSNTGQPV